MDGLFNPIPPISATQYVNGAQPQTVADLLANYPASEDTRGLYARVSDLYGSVDDIMRCRWDGSAFRWVPQRDSFQGSNATTTAGALTVQPLITPPILDLTATLTGNVNVGFSAVNAYVGQQQLVRARGVLGLFGISLTGLVGGGTLALLSGGDRTVIFTREGWKG